MKKITWIVENFAGDNAYEDLITEVKNQGMDCHVLDITNHFDLKQSVINQCKNDCVIFQGSIQMFRKLKKETSLAPLGWQTDKNYLCSKYWPLFTDILFNDKFVMVPLATLKQHKFFFYGVFGKDTLIYVRPDRGDKLFKGQLLDLQEFDRMWKDGISSDATDSDIIVVSTPKNIRGEWRYIVSDKKEIIAMSTYMYQGNRTYIPSAPNGATELCKEVLSRGYYPDPFFTIDICEDNDGKYWFMEMNSFTSAGTYEASKKNIVEKISNSALNL